MARFITTLDDAENGFRHELIPIALSHQSHASQSLRSAILALCAFHLGYQDDALQHKTRALRSLQLSLRVDKFNYVSAQVAACMMLCVYGVFDTNDGNWAVHLGGARTIAKQHSRRVEFSPFLRSWLLYHEVLSQFSLRASNEIEISAILDASKDKYVVSIYLMETMSYSLM